MVEDGLGTGEHEALKNLQSTLSYAWLLQLEQQITALDLGAVTAIDKRVRLGMSLAIDKQLAEAELIRRRMTLEDHEFLQPIQMRFNELLAGVRAELAIKVFGDDIETLNALGAEIQDCSRYGKAAAVWHQQGTGAVAGTVARTFYESDIRSDIVVRLDETRRSRFETLAYLPIHLPNGGFVPLQELADLQLTSGTNQNLQCAPGINRWGRSPAAARHSLLHLRRRWLYCPVGDRYS
jgi:Cu/Ag efflux pump CusA